MFIAREAEINALKEKYDSSNFEFAIIYGRRRVGKTRLIEEFTKDKNCIFFSAMKEITTETIALFNFQNVSQVQMMTIFLFSNHFRVLSMK